MSYNLKEIKTRYEGAKCAKCNREIKKGWTVYFDPDAVPKVVYCKPCGQKLLTEPHKGEEKSSQIPDDVSEDFARLVNELAGDLKLSNVTLSAQGDDLAEIKKLLISLTSVVADFTKPKKK